MTPEAPTRRPDPPVPSIRPRFVGALTVVAALALGCGTVIVPSEQSGSAAGAGGASAATSTGAGGQSSSGGACASPAWSRAFPAPGLLHNGSDPGLATDLACNTYLVGTLSGPIDFGLGPLQNAGHDLYLAKLDAAGHPLWSRTFAGESTGDPASVAVDHEGNIVLTGTFTGHIDFGKTTLVTAGASDVFVAKLDPEGGLLWSRGFGAPGGAAIAARDVVVDADDAVLLGGWYTGKIDLGAGPVESAGGNDGFVVKLDASGGVVWGKRFGGAHDDRVYSLAVHGAGLVTVVGIFEESLPAFGLQNPGLDQALVLRFDSSGNFVWAHSFGVGANEDQAAASVVARDDGHVVVAGSFRDAVDLGAGPVPSQGDFDAFVAELDAQGSVVWGRSFGGKARDQAWSVALDGAGKAIVTGEYRGALDLGGGPLPASTGGLPFAFVLELDPTGNHLASAGYGSAGGTASGYQVRVDAGGLAVFAGVFTGAAAFGGGTTTAPGVFDVSLARGLF